MIEEEGREALHLLFGHWVARRDGQVLKWIRMWSGSRMVLICNINVSQRSVERGGARKRA